MSKNKGDDFSLKSDSDGFNTRLNSVFENLQPLEQNHESWRKTQDSSDSKRLWKNEPEDVEFAARTFKLPNAPRIENKWRPQHPRNSPKLSGFQQNPSQWVKYSLADVSDYDLSDKTNTKTALNFIHMRKRQRLQENPDSNEDPVSEKPVFRKPSKQSLKDSIEHSEVFASKSGVTTMPECVIGLQKPLKMAKASVSKRSVSKSPDSGKPVCLDHLNEDEGSDSNDDEMSDKTQKGGSCSGVKFINAKQRCLRTSCDEDMDN